MSRYGIRVQLKGSPSAQVYEDLHYQLGLNGVMRHIIADDGRRYLLPHATYEHYSSLSACQVRDWLQPIVGSVWNDYDMVVYDYVMAAWWLPEYAVA